MWSEDNLFKPLMTAYVPNPIPLKYILFRNEYDAKFYGDCQPYDQNAQVVNAIIDTSYDVSSLASQCDQYKTEDSFKEPFITISDIALKPDQYESYKVAGQLVVIYIENARDASLVFSNQSKLESGNDTFFELCMFSQLFLIVLDAMTVNFV